MNKATAIKGGAPASPTTTSLRAEWGRKLLAYQLAQALYNADGAFGPRREAYRAHDEERARVEREYGSVARAQATPDGEARLSRSFERMDKVEQASNDAYLTPLWAAQRELVRTPAPDFAALKLKVELIEKEEVWNDRDLEEDCFELIQADVERLRGEA